MEFRWMEGPEAVERLNPIILAKGWTPLNPATSRAIVAEQDGAILGFLVLQLFPMVGPALALGTEKENAIALKGMLARMGDFMQETNARGYMVVVEHAKVAELCERFGLEKLEMPVYVG